KSSRPSLEGVLDRLVQDRIPCNECNASYRLPAVTCVQLRGPRRDPGFHPSDRPSLWVDGRYVGEVAEGCQVHIRDNSSTASDLTVRGHFRHLAFVIEEVR